MIRATRFFSTSGMQHGFAWVSIFFCFTSVASVAVSQNMQLQILPQVTARCGENVTLMCNFSSSNLDMQLMTFSLMAENATKTCKYNNDQAGHEFRCESTTNTSHQTLAMILTNIMPVSEGKYICKVYTNKGLLNNLTYVKVQDCSGSSDSSRNATHATCSFSGVYPNGVVHWYLGDANITNATITKEEKDQHGLYSVQSTIRTEENKLSLPYKCFLWIPSLNKNLSRQDVKLSSSLEVKSTGTKVKLQWLCILMLSIMM